MSYDIRNGTLLAVAIALLLNVLVFLIGRFGFNVTPSVAQDPSPVSLIAVILITLITTISAGLIFWLLQRSSASFVQIFLWLAAIVALLSLYPVYTLAIGQASFFSLGLMHVFTAASAVYGLLYFSRCENCEEA